MDIHKNIGEKLRKARSAYDLTQAKVAKYLGVKRKMVSYFETGSRPISLVELRTCGHFQMAIDIKCSQQRYKQWLCYIIKAG